MEGSPEQGRTGQVHDEDGDITTVGDSKPAQLEPPGVHFCLQLQNIVHEHSAISPQNYQPNAPYSTQSPNLTCSPSCLRSIDDIPSLPPPPPAYRPGHSHHVEQPPRESASECTLRQGDPSISSQRDDSTEVDIEHTAVEDDPRKWSSLRKVCTVPSASFKRKSSNS